MNRKPLLLISLLILSLSPLLWLKRNKNPFQPEMAQTGQSGQMAQMAPDQDQVTVSSASAVFHPAVQITPEDQEKIHILDQVLTSKNDNDPRLDHELRNLGPGAKALMQIKYEQLPAESRNERGTIVFLMGRNLNTGEDFQFMESVLKETPCRSLSDCRKDTIGSVSHEDLHHDLGTDVTLAYPQLAALKAAEANLFSKSRDEAKRASDLRLVEVGRQSPVAKVASLANDIFERYQSRH